MASYSILTTLLIKQFQQVEACFRISAGADPSLSLSLPPHLPLFFRLLLPTAGAPAVLSLISISAGWISLCPG